MFNALITEWSEPRQTPQQAVTGTPGALLRNPMLPAGWVEGVVEHLPVWTRRA